MKYSKQRVAILSFLKTRKDHPTAETVYLNVKEDFPNISLGTVYRNLSQLADNGTITRLRFGDLGTDCFDADISAHEHFVCTSCNSVIDLPMSSLSFIDQVANESFDGLIQGHNIYFSGLCKNCLTKHNVPSV